MAHEILDLMRVPKTQDIYVLGCFGRYVTFYSQQVRAINLAYALNKERQLRSKRIAVIGAGAAGITFTAAAVRLGATVTLLEKLPQIMGIQRGSYQRYIHPHIYDWPAKQFKQTRAGLPFLDWVADYAHHVVEQLEKKWEAEIRSFGSQIRFLPNVHGVSIEVDPIETATDVSWNTTAGFDYGQFDIVVLAVGFGLESSVDGNQSRYWQDDWISKVDERYKLCLISGSGDGGLTDLMQLCVSDFRHDQVVSAWAEDAESIALGVKILKLEEECFQSSNYNKIRDFFRELNVPSMQEVFKPRLRSDTKVYLSSKSLKDIYGPRSCILNRLVVSQLSKLGA